jgi:iron complex outermembrane receptor protein
VCAVESTAGGPPNHRRLRSFAISLLLASVAVPAHANSTAGAGSDAAQPTPQEQGSQDIYVTGQSLFRGVTPESDLDEEAIESYGVSTVDDLLGEVESELGEDEAPLILVNGERVDDLSDIGAYPVEALRNVQVLPRGSAVRIGGTTRQRVISLTLQRKMRAATVTAAPKLATGGDWHAGRGEALLTYLQNSTRANIGFRVRDESSLLESERGIIQPEIIPAFATAGNVVGFPDTAGEIDPLLSALAGQVVTVAPFPAMSSPTLAAFVPQANNPALTDLGEFRTLWPDTTNYELNGTFSTRLAPWLTSNVGIRVSHNVSRSLLGLPSGLFILSPTNASSPFSTDVGLAFYGQDPLRSRSETNSGDGKLTLNAHFGRWVSNFDARHSESRSTYRSEQQSVFLATPLDDSIDPFTTDLSNLIGITTNRSSSRTTNNLTQLSFTGPAFTLPAGAVQTTLEGRLSWYRLHSLSSFFADSDRTFHRDEQAIRGAIDVPLTSRDANVLPAVGNLSVDAEYALIHYSDAGSLHHHAVGVTWEPLPPLRLRGSIEQTEQPASIQNLGNPIVQFPEVRVFDPLTGETVDVTQINGGNPSLRPQKVNVRQVGALLRLVPRFDLQLNAEYTDTDARNFISSLPPASLPVMLAFPDRYIRNSNGVLTIVDLRPVNFDTHREKRLRWGLSMRARLVRGNILGAALAAPADSDSGDPAAEQQPVVLKGGRTPSTYLQLSFDHTIVFSDELRIRPDLDTVDLLGGGALGIGGGRVRHQLDGTAALTSGGLGARAGVTWRGASTLDTSINGISDTLRFSPLFLFNLRLFADARRFAPSSSWAKGLRLSVDVVNLTNARQNVRDSMGNTPLQYQPGYRDPLGRTIELEIRKVF